MPINADLLRDNFELVLQRDQVFPRRFYEILFARRPEVQPLFTRNSASAQHALLAQTLMAALDHADEPAWLTEKLAPLGAQHAAYGVTAEMYQGVGDALIAAIAEVSAADWTDELQAAWTEAYWALVSIMCPSAHPSR
mgnify:CR=1 FL=1